MKTYLLKNICKNNNNNLINILIKSNNFKNAIYKVLNLNNNILINIFNTFVDEYLKNDYSNWNFINSRNIELSIIILMNFNNIRNDNNKLNKYYSNWDEKNSDNFDLKLNDNIIDSLKFLLNFRIVETTFSYYII